MSIIVHKLVFALALLRMLAAVVVVGATGYGVYILANGDTLAGLTWIVAAPVCGFIGNYLFRMIYMLASAGAATSAPAMKDTKAKYATGNRTRFAGSHHPMLTARKR